MPSVLIAIVGCHARQSYIQQQRSTWLADFSEYDAEYKIFYGGNGNRAPKADEVFLDCSDEYLMLPYKTRAIMGYVREHGYQHVFKCDDDVFVIAGNLFASNFKEYDYHGGVVYPTGRRVPYAAGYTYWLSAKAASIIADSEVPEGQTLEDVWVGDELEKHGIHPHMNLRYTEMHRFNASPTQLFSPAEEIIAVTDHRKKHRGVAGGINLEEIKQHLEQRARAVRLPQFAAQHCH